MLSVQKLYETVITSHSFHNLFEIGLMKGVRYFVEVLGVRYFVESSTFVCWKEVEYFSLGRSFLIVIHF